MKGHLIIKELKKRDFEQETKNRAIKNIRLIRDDLSRFYDDIPVSATGRGDPAISLAYWALCEAEDRLTGARSGVTMKMMRERLNELEH